MNEIEQMIALLTFDIGTIFDIVYEERMLDAQMLDYLIHIITNNRTEKTFTDV